MSNKDWKGNAQSVMATLNASNHSEKQRAEYDWYATPRVAIDNLVLLEQFDSDIWEPACGTLDISNVLEEYGYKVRSSDLIHRADHEVLDFLSNEVREWKGHIVTNPPFALANEFLLKSLSIIPDGYKVVFFLRIQFLEGVKRREIFNEYPPVRIWVSSRNIRCAKNADFKNASGNASTYAFFVWEKGFKGKPTLGWFN